MTGILSRRPPSDTRDPKAKVIFFFKENHPELSIISINNFHDTVSITQKNEQ